MRGFVLGDFDSVALGCRVTSPPAMQPTARTVDTVEIVGGEGFVTRPKGWGARTVEVGLLVPSLDVVDKLSLQASQCDGAALRLSHVPGRFWRCLSAEVSDVTRFSATRWQLKLSVSVRPFAYLDSGEEPVVVDGAVEMENPTGVEALPRIVITSPSAIDVLFVVFQSDQGRPPVPLVVKHPGGTLVVDSDSMMTTVGGEPVRALAAASFFPRLGAGVWRVSVQATGNVTVTIYPRWRTA